MIALGAGLVAVACVVSAGFMLRRLGAGYRIARLLSAAPIASVAEVAEIARSGERRYMRAKGRVRSDEEFPDEQDRPLVFRRRALERGDARGGWVVFDEERLAVPFGIEDRTAFVAVDADALGEGLVVVTRESVGTLADLPSELALLAGAAADARTPVRLRIDQVSAVEHATVAGVPAIGPSGPMLTAGLGRPLILSTLEAPSAMRLLAGGRRRSVIGAAALLVLGLGAAAVAIVAFLAAW